jgi:hypothetical protein
VVVDERFGERERHIELIDQDRSRDHASQRVDVSKQHQNGKQHIKNRFNADAPAAGRQRCRPGVREAEQQRNVEEHERQVGTALKIVQQHHGPIERDDAKRARDEKIAEPLIAKRSAPVGVSQGATRENEENVDTESAHCIDGCNLRPGQNVVNHH